MSTETLLSEQEVTVSEPVAHLYCRLCEEDARFSAVCGWEDIFSTAVDNPTRRCVSCEEILHVVRKCPQGHYLWIEDLP